MEQQLLVATIESLVSQISDLRERLIRAENKIAELESAKQFPHPGPRNQQNHRPKPHFQPLKREQRDNAERPPRFDPAKKDPKKGIQKADKPDRPPRQAKQTVQATPLTLEEWENAEW